MPYYRVMLHGTEIRIPGEDPGQPIVGFYATRLVRGDSEDVAVLLAKERVTAEWAGPEYSAINLGRLPVLRAESVTRTSFLDRLMFPNKGHVFYASGDDEVQR